MQWLSVRVYARASAWEYMLYFPNQYVFACAILCWLKHLSHTQSRRLGLLVYTQVLEIYGFEPLEVTDALVGFLADALNTQTNTPRQTDL